MRDLYTNGKSCATFVRNQGRLRGRSDRMTHPPSTALPRLDRPSCPREFASKETAPARGLRTEAFLLLDTAGRHGIQVDR